MTKIRLVLGALLLTAVAAACNNEPANCNCIALAACTTANNYGQDGGPETCGVGLVCCPPLVFPDAG